MNKREEDPPAPPPDVQARQAAEAIRRQHDIQARIDEQMKPFRLYVTWGVAGSAKDLIRADNGDVMKVSDVRALLLAAETQHQQQAEELRMGHVRVNECTGSEQTKGQPLYDRISWVLQRGAERQDAALQAQHAEFKKLTAYFTNADIRAGHEWNLAERLIAAELQAQQDAARILELEAKLGDAESRLACGGDY